MSTIKSDRMDFEKLLNGIDPVVPQVNTPTVPTVGAVQGQQPVQGQQKVAVDNPPAAQLMNEPLFVFDYDAERKGIRKKCRKTIMGIVKHVIPDNMVDDEYIQDKIEQDIETITELYMQVKLNTVMQRAHVEMTARGGYTARNSEVFGQLTDKIQSINKQIFDTEQRIRKTYLDLKYEIRDKQGEDFALNGGNSQTPQLTNGTGPNGGYLVSSSKVLVDEIKDIKKRAVMAKETKVEVVQ